MTSLAWPARPDRDAQGAARATLADAAAFAAGLLVLLTYSQAWLAPLTDYGRGPEPAGLIRVIYFPAYLATLLLLAQSPARSARALLGSPLLILLLLVTAASALWSVDPAATSRRLVAIGFTTLGGVALAARFRWSSLAELIAAGFALMALGSLAVALAVPDWGRMSETFPGAWRGLWLEKNNLGGNMAAGFAACCGAAVLAPARRRLWIAAAVLCLGLVLTSTSKTALVVLALSAGSLVFVWLARRGPAAGVAMAWTALVGLALGAAVALFAADALFDLLGKDATLTGRTEIWDGIARVTAERTWRGFGYGAVWDNDDPYGPLAWITHYAGFKAGHAHNGWMELWLNIGLAGVIVFALWFAEIWLRTLGAVFTGGPAAWLLLPAMVGYSLTMLTESITLSWHDLRWVLLVALAVKLALPAPPPQPARALRASSAVP